MAWTQKHRDGWLARWQEFDVPKMKRVTKSKRFATLEEAEAYAESMKPAEAFINPKTWSRDTRELMGIDLPTSLDEKFRVDKYLVRMVDDLDVRDTSRAAYRTSVRLHFVGDFARADIRTLTGEDITRWWRSLVVKPGAKRRAHQLLRMAVKRVIQTGDRPDDPFLRAPDVKRPRPKRRDVQVLTIEEIEKLAKHAPNDRARVGILVQAYGGLRAGELGGLHVEDVEGPVLRLKRQVVRVPGQGVVESELKTKAAKRTVTLPSSVAEQLREYIGDQTSGSVFGLRDSVRINDDIYKARKAAGITKVVSSHTLRHSYVSQLVNSGASPLDVQRAVGHSRIEETLGTYGWAWSWGGEQLADKLEELRNPS
jgi:integrase